MLARSKACLGLPIRPHSNESNLCPILPRFRDIRAFVRQNSLFSAPHPNSGENFENFWRRPVMLGSAESEHPWLTNLEVIFEEFQPVITIHQRHRQTDGRTDTGQTTCDRRPRFAL